MAGVGRRASATGRWARYQAKHQVQRPEGAWLFNEILLERLAGAVLIGEIPNFDPPCGTTLCDVGGAIYIASGTNSLAMARTKIKCRNYAALGKIMNRNS